MRLSLQSEDEGPPGREWIKFSGRLEGSTPSLLCAKSRSLQYRLRVTNKETPFAFMLLACSEDAFDHLGFRDGVGVHVGPVLSGEVAFGLLVAMAVGAVLAEAIAEAKIALNFRAAG